MGGIRKIRTQDLVYGDTKDSKLSSGIRKRNRFLAQFQGSWRLGTAQALHAQYKYVSSVDIRHLGTPYERVPRFLSTRELMVGNLRDSEAARYVLSVNSDIMPELELSVSYF